MTGWHSKMLGDAVEAYNPTMEIMEYFTSLALTNAQATGQHVHDAAVFSQDDPETNLVTVYFTPSAEAVAVRFGATPCEKPESTEGLSLLCGEATAAWEAHFPDRHRIFHGA